MDGLTKDERRTAATLWAVSAAPMYIGNDMTKLDTYGLDLLTNHEVIAVNQAGPPGTPVSTKTQAAGLVLAATRTARTRSRCSTSARPTPT